MADFAILGEAAAREMGYAPMEWFNAYNQATKEQNAEAVLNTTLGSTISTLMFYKDCYEGTAAKLLRELKNMAAWNDVDVRGNDFPHSPIALSRRLTTMSPSLEAIGIKVVKVRGHDRKIIIRRIDPKEKTQTILGETNTTQTEEAALEAPPDFKGWD